MQSKMSRFVEIPKKDKTKMIDTLMHKIENCNECNIDNLKDKVPNNFLRGKGDLNCDIMFVGIAPSYYKGNGDLFTNPDNVTDKIFIDSLEANELHRDDVYVTNLSKGSTLENRMLTEAEIKHLFTHLVEETNIIHPRIIVFMGHSVFRSLNTNIIEFNGIAVIKIRHVSMVRHGFPIEEFYKEIAKVVELARRRGVL